MKTLNRNLLVLTAALLAAGFGTAFSKSASKAPALVVIVKADGALAGLDSKDIKAIYLGDKQFQNGDKIEPLVNGDEVLTGLFLKKVLNKSKAQYKKIWSGKAFIDGVSAPTVLPSSDDVIRQVGKNSDAIGFVLEKDISTEDKQVKVIYSVNASED
jgi:ABC-type phosphate transport system substrate-binding protein